MVRPFAIPITLTAPDRTTLSAGPARRRPPKHRPAGPDHPGAAEPSTTNTTIAAHLHVAMMTATKWRHRFAAHGLAGTVISELHHCHRSVEFQQSSTPSTLDPHVILDNAHS